jgi:hypothetical protein
MALVLKKHIYNIDERGCGTSRKVAGSRPDEVKAIINLSNPSGRNMPSGLLNL